MGHGFNPWSGKIPHAGEQLSAWPQLPKPASPKACALESRGYQKVSPADHSKRKLAHSNDIRPSGT